MSNPTFISSYHIGSSSFTSSTQNFSRRVSLKTKNPVFLHRKRVNISQSFKLTIKSEMPTSIELVQLARIVMAVVELSTIATNLIIQPMYIPAQCATVTPVILQQIQAVGLANLNLFTAIQMASSQTKLKHLVNFIIMTLTGLIYLVLPVKPLWFVIPFTSSLFILAVLNAWEELKNQNVDTKQPFTSTFGLFTQAFKFLAASATLFFAFGLNGIPTPTMMSQVYLMQISLNIIASSFVSLRGKTTPIYDALLLGCIAFLIKPTSDLLAIIFTVSAASAAITGIVNSSDSKDKYLQE